MLQGMSPEQKKKLGLTKATDYTYLTIVRTKTAESLQILCASITV